MHVWQWYISLRLVIWLMFMIHVCKYTTYMDPTACNLPKTVQPFQIPHNSCEGYSINHHFQAGAVHMK